MYIICLSLTSTTTGVKEIAPDTTEGIPKHALTVSFLYRNVPRGTFPHFY